MRRILLYFFVLLLSPVAVTGQLYHDEFLQLQVQFQERTKTAYTDLEEYLSTYPYSPYADEVYLMEGVLLSEKEKYKAALIVLDKTNPKVLSRSTEDMYYFYSGYTHLQMEDYDKALTYLLPLKQKVGVYNLQAKYYTAYCYYKQELYPQALADFLSIEEVSGYKKIAPYYIVQIYYALGEYDKVCARAEELLKLYPENEYNDELHRMLGELYYSDAQYKSAAQHLLAYQNWSKKKKKEILRNDRYLLGISYYQLGEYSNAIDQLKQVKLLQDTISESTCLHLGHCYLSNKNIEKAKLSYSTAIQYNLTPALREEAMYNYVQLSHQQNSALGEDITALQMFINEYPKSRHIDQIYSLMADVYLNSKNYRSALGALLEVQQPTEQIKQTLQYLRYQLAADAYLQGKMQEVIDWCQQIQTHTHEATRYQLEAYYLAAEAQYRLMQYDSCISLIDQYEQHTHYAESANQSNASYLKAYAWFNEKDYEKAQPIFQTYLGKIQAQHHTYPDAMNRIGDCHFHSRQFELACKAYEEVVSIGKAGADYALLQQGTGYGLLQQYDNKIQALEKLAKLYPSSNLADDALYESARAHLQIDQHDKAIEVYQQLIQKYPLSNKTAKAQLELGMAYRTLQQYDQAIETFKQTISQHAGTEEAYSALDGLEQVYVETNNVSEYIAYTKTLDKMNMQISSSEDSLMYVTAELQFMLGHYESAAAGLSTYLTRFCPGGRYCVTAMYYAANSYYQLKEYSQAIEQYSALADVEGNPYMEEACMRVAELSYDQKEYHTAMYYFQRMQQVASSQQMQIMASLGVLRCGYQVQDTLATIEVASQLLEIETLDLATQHEARYCRANAYRQQKEYGLALVDYSTLAKEVRTKRGAEAKYRVAECYYHLGALDMAEGEIMSFAGMHTSHQYWLAKSLILLADINVSKGDLFQAKQYLLALQNNYRIEDEIPAIIQEKLEEVNQLSIETQPQTNENDSI
jgi:tetratricopeptide (TPR) repeat protein